MGVVVVIVAGVALVGLTARRGTGRSPADDTAVPRFHRDVVEAAPSRCRRGLRYQATRWRSWRRPSTRGPTATCRTGIDIGAHVPKGQLMAEIETPEVDQQLQVAQADLKSAQANWTLANTTSARYQNLLKTNSVSKQETDVAMSDAAAKKAAVDASTANVRRLEQLQSFEKVYAPFDGIVTARNTDVGRLISAGQNTTPQELFHLAAIEKIRVYVAVPEAYSSAIKVGGKASLRRWMSIPEDRLKAPLRATRMRSIRRHAR